MCVWKEIIVTVWVYCSNACFGPRSKLYFIQYRANQMTDFERMILAILVVFLILVNMPVTSDYFLHVSNICTTKAL